MNIYIYIYIYAYTVYVTLKDELTGSVWGFEEMNKRYLHSHIDVNNTYCI